MTKSNNTKKSFLVLGGYGFIGRHVIDHLRRMGHKVVVSSRKPSGNEDAIKVVAHKDSIGELEAKVKGFDAVINTIGILRERLGESYEAVHHHFVDRVARVCSDRGTRFVHVSALGLNNPVRSRFLTSKADSELALRRSGADWVIVRPSIIDGDGGYGAKWFRRVARWPVHFAPVNSKGQLQPIHVKDLAEAIAVLALAPQIGRERREIELGGEDVVAIFEYLELLKGSAIRWQLKVPAWLARVCSHVCDLLYLTPFSFGHYELLKFDNLPVKNHLPRLLGRAPRLIGLKTKETVFGGIHA